MRREGVSNKTNSCLGPSFIRAASQNKPRLASAAGDTVRNGYSKVRESLGEGTLRGVANWKDDTSRPWKTEGYVSLSLDLVALVEYRCQWRLAGGCPRQTGKKDIARCEYHLSNPLHERVGCPRLHMAWRCFRTRAPPRCFC